MECWAKRKERTKQEVDKKALQIQKKALKKGLDGESANVWANYFKENSTLKTQVITAKIENEKSIRKACLNKKLDPEKAKEWILLYQKFHATVPIYWILYQIQQGKDISLEKVISNNEKRSQMVKGFALTLGYSTEESEKWREVSAQLPHISDSLIKKSMEQGEKEYQISTPRDFETFVGELDKDTALQYILVSEDMVYVKNEDPPVYSRCEYKVDLQEYDEHIWTSGDSASASDSVAGVQQQDEQMQMYASGDIDGCSFF